MQQITKELIMADCAVHQVVFLFVGGTALMVLISTFDLAHN